ncbi:MAG TPA: DUF3160 domain-containing protein [Clostridia bacterium]|nr:DUF3160 domain-containing protein [Clostridia bacterium]
MKSKGKIRLLPLCMVLLLLVMTGCNQNSGKKDSEQNAKTVIPPLATTTGFANYNEKAVDCSPSVEPYKVDPELGNITNRDMFEFSAEAKRLLVENGFVVMPGSDREFFMLYEINSYEPIPSFITTDSMLHNYHLFFSHLLRVIEKEKLAIELEELTEAMLLETKNQYKTLKGTDWENAALRNLGFFAVAGKLLNPGISIPEEITKEVNQELELIKSHEGIEISPLMSLGQNLNVLDSPKEDYSQYIPRGHYDNDESLRSYFKAMMWYGRITFRLKDEDETKSAALMTLALDKNDNLQKWDKIYQPTCFFVGKSDDLSYPQYNELLGEIYGNKIDLKEITANKDKWQDFLKAATKLEPPTINSIPIFDEEIQPDREAEIKGFRFMGQRFTLDASIFQRLVYREVKEDKQGQRRMLPKALDIPAALGSEEAYTILEDTGETGYEGYPENMDKLRKYIADLDGETWTQNLYWSWLYTLDTLIGEKSEGYPSFMHNKAWLHKELNTFLSSWTELKHDTILYAKQIYAEMGGGMAGVDDRGYVEPNPKLYARLAALVNMTREGLSTRGLIDDRDQENLERLEQLALSLKIISEKELSDIPLTDEEYDLIRSYGGQLEHFWLEALRDEGVDHRSAIYENPAALVADVATDPNGNVLQEATGHIYEIYAVVPVEGSLRIAKGGVYSHYEFDWPIDDRLTDKKWQEMLNAGEAPPLAPWTKTFIAQ